jgi:hypothetical protein
MLSIAIVLDIVKFAAGVVLTYYVFYLYQKEFRSGVMEEGFRMIAISMLILTAARIFDLVSAILPTNGLADDLSTVLGTAFSLVLAYGFFLLYSVWHIDKKETRVEKTINA